MPLSFAHASDADAAAGYREGGNEHAPLMDEGPGPGTGTGLGLGPGSMDGQADQPSNPRSAAAAAAADDDDDDGQQTKSVWYLILLTISIGGLQIAWSVELSNGSPYLLSLGLSKSLMALVWIAGPLSGTLVQPYVGMLSDHCRVSWGKRKPFMLGGAAATMVSLLGLAWTRELVAGPLQLVFGVDPEARGVRVAVVVVAVLWVYVLDFAINTVQAAIRAFIVDCAPAHQQEAANAMASRITGVGNIVGYVAGYANLPRVLWWLGDTQFKDLCAIAALALGATVGLSCATVRERDPRRAGPAPGAAQRAHTRGVVAFFRAIFASMRRLPPQTKKVCAVQFCAWVGFFPMLFYTSSYIGEIYVEPFLEENPHMTPAELDRLYEQATRVGTFALLVYSITSLCTNVFLPFFIAPTYDTPAAAARRPRHRHRPRPRPRALALAIEPPAADDAPTKKNTSWLEHLVIPGFTLRRAWMLSLLLFSASMFCTVLVRSVAAATALIGLVGITWALTLWAPWAIISAEISHRDAQIRLRKQRRAQAASGGVDGAAEEAGDDHDDHDDHDDADDEPVDQAGVILGIHNMAIAAPQIIATVGSSIVFKFLQKPRGTPGDHSIAVVMALGGVTVLLAAYFVHKIDDDIDGSGDPAAAAAADGPYYMAVGREEEEAGLNDDDDDDGDDGDIQNSLPRRVSSERLSRASLERAALARSSSFGGGLEY